MYHKAYIRLIDTHAEGVGGDNDAHLTLEPLILTHSTFHGGKTRMIVGGIYALGLELLGKLLAALTCSHIDDTRALNAIYHTQQMVELILDMAHHI